MNYNFIKYVFGNKLLYIVFINFFVDIEKKFEKFIKN